MARGFAPPGICYEKRPDTGAGRFGSRGSLRSVNGSDSDCSGSSLPGSGCARFDARHAQPVADHQPKSFADDEPESVHGYAESVCAGPGGVRRRNGCDSRQHRSSHCDADDNRQYLHAFLDRGRDSARDGNACRKLKPEHDSIDDRGVELRSSEYDPEGRRSDSDRGQCMCSACCNADTDSISDPNALVPAERCLESALAARLNDLA